MTEIIVTIMFILISLISLNSEKSIEGSYDVEAQTMHNVNNAVHASARASSSPAVKNNFDHSNIDKTLRSVAENFMRIDTNGDGLHNCIDAAILFYQYYPDKSKVCIVLNRNPNTGMNHLFNWVSTDGVWEAIEPQAYISNHSNYLMRAVWGSQYDNSYSRNVTDDYIRYVSK